MKSFDLNSTIPCCRIPATLRHGRGTHAWPASLHVGAPRGLAQAVGALPLIVSLACQPSSTPDQGEDEPSSGQDEDLDTFIETEDVGAPGDGDGDVGCAQAETSAQLLPNNLLFVVDKSGSMNCNAPPSDNECLLPEKKVDNEPSKWQSTHAALVGTDDPDTERNEQGLFRQLSGDLGLSAGLITFPVDSRCAILPRGDLTTDIAPLDAAQVEALDSALTLVPEGETPLAGAAIRGLDVLRERLVSGELTGNSYLVLMTDGVETCQAAALDDLKEYVPIALWGFDIRTYVIGAPGSEGSRALLSQIAHLGGTSRTASCQHESEAATEGDCHIDLTESQDFSGDLAQVFQELGQSAQASCAVDVPQDAFVDPDKVNVVFSTSEGARETIYYDDRDCSTSAHGWQYTSKEQERILVCGQACERLRADPGARLKVVFGCEETLLR